MGIRRVCDRCGKDVHPYAIKGVDVCMTQAFQKYRIRSRKYDLCRECFAELEDWLKENEEEK